MTSRVVAPPTVRHATLAISAVLFAAIFLLRIAIDDPDEVITLLFAIPVALLAVELGVVWGMAAAALGLTLFGIWDAGWNDGAHSTLDYVIRGAVLFTLGGLVGALADRVRRMSSTSANTERFLDAVLHHLPNMVFVKDSRDLRFVRFNKAGEDLLGSSRHELIGKSDHDLFPKHEADAFVQKDREVLSSDAIVDIPAETIQTPHGQRILHTRKIAIRDDSGEPRYLLGISEDITERRRAEQAVEIAAAEAERANLAKSEFLSRMSHELRTPLNAVIGFGQLLELDDLDARQREAVGQILKAGRHLLELINEVLDISRIESGTMSISLEPVHLGSVLTEALSLIRPMADAAEVRLVSDPTRYEHMHVHADQQRLKQVFINLLSNAVKYNRRDGEVSVHCRELDEGLIEIAVADSGHGMTPSQMERLFEPFERLGAESSAVEGTGLGLSICRGLMDAMGGAIDAESEPGTGTTIRLRLRRAEQPPVDRLEPRVPRAAGRAAPGSRRTVVYIEDNLSNLRLIERLLEDVPDVRLIPAMQGTLGVNLARQHLPDLILLDLHLPDMNGREVLEHLKRDPATASIPVVVLSADASPSEIERLRLAGAASYLTKPLDVHALLDTLHALPWSAAAASRTS